MSSSSGQLNNPLSEEGADTLCLAANIIVTLQTVKMVMAGTEQASVSQRCMIAGELLDGLGSVPTAYIHASSTPMVSTRSPYLGPSCRKIEFVTTNA